MNWNKPFKQRFSSPFIHLHFSSFHGLPWFHSTNGEREIKREREETKRSGRDRVPISGGERVSISRFAAAAFFLSFFSRLPLLLQHQSSSPLNARTHTHYRTRPIVGEGKSKHFSMGTTEGYGELRMKVVQAKPSKEGGTPLIVCVCEHAKGLNWMLYSDKAR